MRKTVVIGVGHLGRHHARIVHESREAELVAVVDPDVERARAVVEPFRTPVFRSVDEVDGADLTFDTAVVAVPTSLHEPVAAPLLERGLAVLVEKPLAPDADAARRLVELANANDAVLQVGHVERFNPAVMAIAAMKLNPVYIEARRISPFTMRSADVGVVSDLMIHDLDIVTRLVDEAPERVEGLGVGVITGKEDMGLARLHFPGGAVADISTSRVAIKTERRIRLFSKTAYVSLDYVKRNGVVYRVDPKLKLSEFGAAGIEALTKDPTAGFIDLFQRGLLSMQSLEMGDHEPLAKQFESFCAAARREHAPDVDGPAGLAAVELAADIQRQIRTFAARFD